MFRALQRRSSESVSIPQQSTGPPFVWRLAEEERPLRTHRRRNPCWAPSDRVGSSHCLRSGEICPSIVQTRATNRQESGDQSQTIDRAQSKGQSLTKPVVWKCTSSSTSSPHSLGTCFTSKPEGRSFPLFRRSRNAPSLCFAEAVCVHRGRFRVRVRPVWLYG
jgi:hypothetical protein